MSAYREHALQIPLQQNQSAQLTGVLTQPKQEASQKPLVLIINSGLIVRTGPYRLHVTLSRQIAALGFECLRVDLSGIGDSDRALTQTANDSQSLADLHAIMDFFTQADTNRRFIIMGICTGADNAHRALMADDRVIGAVCVDGYSYPTARYYLNHYLPKLVNGQTWRNLFSKVYRRLAMHKQQRANTPKAYEQQLDYRWELPPKAKTQADFSDMIQRKVRMLCIYSSDWPYNYTDQLADAFPALDFEDYIRLAYLEDAKHTFPVLADRQRLTDTIEQWLTDFFSQPLSS